MKDYIKFAILLALVLTLAGLVRTGIWPIFERESDSAREEKQDERSSALELEEQGRIDDASSAVASTNSLQSSHAKPDASAVDHDALDDTFESDDRVTMTDRVRETLDSSELGSAYPVYLALSQCRNLIKYDPTWDKARNEFQRLQANPGTPPGHRIRLEIRDVSFDQMHEECHRLHESRDRILESEIATKARRGDPYARFVYAMWPPHEDASITSNLDENLTYEANALNFTLENLAAGHPLGLLALGLSYSKVDYFTPYRSSLGIALLIAAQICSNGDFQIDHEIELYFQLPSYKFANRPSHEQVLEAGTRLHDIHCATSITGTQR
jgi:hypothetical protein